MGRIVGRAGVTRNGKREPRWNSRTRTGPTFPLIDNSPPPPTTTTTGTNLQTHKTVHDVDRHRSLQATRIRLRPLPHPQIRHRLKPDRTILLSCRRLLLRPRILLGMGHDRRCGHVPGWSQVRHQLGRGQVILYPGRQTARYQIRRRG